MVTLLTAQTISARLDILREVLQLVTQYGYHQLSFFTLTGTIQLPRGPIFTALHAMQTRTSDENSVRLSVRHTRAL